MSSSDVDASDHSGWSSENDPWGGGSSGSGINWGGGSGNGNSGNQGGNSGGNTPSVTAMAFGFPQPLLASAGALNLAFPAEALSAEMAKILARLQGPMKLGLWGIALYAVLPTEIAKDDPNMMSRIVTSLPADVVTETPLSNLPLDQATVSVTKRIVDEVKDLRQHIAVVGGLPMSVPVVDAKPTKSPGVFSASVPGLPDLRIGTGQNVNVSTTLARGITKEEETAARPAGFTFGGNTHDIVIRFPKDSGKKPVYVSITDVLSPEKVKKQQEEEERRQQEWDARHPVEAAERQYEEAAKAVARAEENVNQQQSTLQKLQQTVEGLLLSDPSRHPISYQKKETAYIKSALRSYILTLGPFEIKNKTDLDKLLDKGAAVFDPIPQGVDPAQTSGDGYDVAQAIRRLTIAEYDALRTRIISRQQEISAAQAALNSALESLKQEEQKEKDAGNKVEVEKEKNKGKIPEVKIDKKIKDQMPGRGWTEQDIIDTVAKGPVGKSLDKRSPKKTPPDYLGRNDPATVYGASGKYVVVNDRTGEVTQISDKTDIGWVDDSRIKWEK